MTPSASSPNLHTVTRAERIERLRQQDADRTACRARIFTLEDDLTATVRRADLAEKFLAKARDQLKKNSTNSHKPPSSDRPAVKKPSPPKPAEPSKCLLPDALDAIIDTKPTICARCAAPLFGDDPQPRRQQIGDIPPQMIIMTEDEDRQYCGAHLKWDFKAIQESGDVTAQGSEARLGVQFKAMFSHWHAYKGGQSSRQEFEHKIEQEIRPAMFNLLEQDLRYDHLNTLRACQGIARGWESFWTFARRAGVDPTNDAAEQAIRRAAVTWRKCSGGTQTDVGAQFVEQMLSCISTFKREGASALAYLTAVMTALATGRPSPPSSRTLHKFTSLTFFLVNAYMIFNIRSNFCL